MAEVTAAAIKAAPATARQAPAPATISRRMFSQPGEAAERSAQARAARALSGALPGPSRSPRQRQRQHLPPGAPPEVAVQARRGRPLPPAGAAYFGSRLGADLSHVRIHDDADAAALAERAAARAFTLGSHVFFNRGEYQPGTVPGRALLAHELAHVTEAPAGPARLLRQPKPDVGGGGEHATGQEHGSRRQRRGRAATAAPAMPVLTLGTMLSLALDRISELHAYAFELKNLERTLNGLLNRPIGPDQEQVYARVQRLLEVLATAAPAVLSLAEMRQVENFPPDIAPDITREAARITGLYLVAIITAFSEHEPEPPPLDQAERAMTTFPSFITDQYLGKSGIPALINAIQQQWEKVQACRTVTNRTIGSRRLDTLINAFPNPKYRITTDLDRALRDARRARERHKEDAFQQITMLTEGTQVRLAAVSALSYYEQFSAWEHELDDHPGLDSFPARLPDARRWRQRFEKIVEQFETYHANTPQEVRDKVIRGGIEALQGAQRDPDLEESWDDIQERLQTITFIHRLGTAALITAAAALTGGLAAAAVESALALAGASEAVAGGGAFVAEVLAFTAVSRAGETLAFGQAPDTSWSEDLFWNALTLGAVKGVGRAFARSMEGASVARKIMIGTGRAATTGLVLHGISEVQAMYRAGGQPMSSEERYRAVVQNVLMLAGFELGGFLTEPLQKRLGAAIGARFNTAFRDQLRALEGERGDLKTQLDQMHRATSTAKQVNTLLDRIDRIMRREMTVLDVAGRRGIMTQGQLQEALGGYHAAISRLELRFAQLGILPPTGERAPMFRPVGRGVVAFAAGGLPLIENLYKAPGASLRDMPEGVLRGQSAAGEVTYYVPGGETSLRLPSYQAAAAGHDAAAAAAHVDEVAAEGLRWLSDPQTGFSALNLSGILADVRPGSMADFLTAMADPRFKQTRDTKFIQFLARNPTAREFARRGGPRLMRKILSQASEGWSSVVDRADRLLDAAPDDAARDSIIRRLDNARDLPAIEDVLGTPRPPREPRPPRAFTGARRSERSWPGFMEQARRFAADHGERLTDEQLDLRATMLQLIDDAQRQRFRYASYEARIQALDAYDSMGARSGAHQNWINQARGDLAEWLFSPDRGLQRSYFLKGIDQRRFVSGVSVLDYSLETGGLRPNGQPVLEWVELKSDLIDEYSGEGVARRYAGEKHGRADLANLPHGDRLSIHFVRDPGAATRRAMLRILLARDSPFARVKFGMTWYPPAWEPGMPHR